MLFSRKNLLTVTIVAFFFLVQTASAQVLPESLGQSSSEATIEFAEDKAEKKAKNKNLPLEAGRTVSFTTNEASWLSLDVSPDGGTIVFELLGDLYTLPIAGGTAEQLTGGMAFDAQPRFSPDGERIVFVSDRSGGDNIWVISTDKADTLQITKSKADLYMSPTWTPDGKYIVTSKSSGLGVGKLWMFHVDGGSGVQLIKKPDNWQTLGAAFGKDERYIWFARRTGGWQYNAQLPQYQLAIYDRETGKNYTQSALYGSAFRPTLSRDGKWLVYGTRHDEHTGLRLRDLDAGDERWLAYPVQRDDQEARSTRDVLPGMAFTPDSKSIIASYGGKIWRIPVEGGDAVEIPFTVDVNLEIGPELTFDYPVDDAPTFTVKQIRDAVPSPDGKKLAFTSLDRLWVMDYPDGTPARLTDMAIGEHQPQWSPDGRSIAYVTWDVDGGHIYKVRADGRGNPQQLTQNAAYYRSLAYSPNGNRLVAVRSSKQGFLEETGGAGSQLIWLPANGGAVTVISPTEGRGAPHFRKNDPDRIYLYAGLTGLISMRWDGTDIKEHVKVKGGTPPGSTNPTNASLIMMAPEGDQALAQVLNDIYVVTVPYVGGDTPTVSVANPAGAAFPAKKLTVVGGQFPTWSADAKKVHWSIGNAHFVYDLDAAKAAEDSAKAAKKAAAADTSSGGSVADSTQAAESDSTKSKKEDKPIYEAKETRIKIEARRDIPQGTLLLTGARIITMNGDEIIENGDILIRNNRIEGVGASGSLDAPGGTKEIDVSGKTIAPGFVDTHAHIWPSFGIHKTQVWEYLANLAYGVTTTRDPQTATTDVLSYTDLVETGELVGPRVYYTGPGVFWFEQIKDAKHAKDVLKRYSEYYDSKTIKQYLAGNRQQRQWVIMAAKEQKLMPTTEGALDLKLNLTQMIDGYPGHEHSFPIYPLYKDIIELTAQSKTVYTPTLLVAYGGPWAENYFYATEEVHDNEKMRRFTPHSTIDRVSLRRAGWFREEQHVFKDHAKFVADLVKAGGLAGVGSHGQLQGVGYHWELWAMQSGGLPEHDALRVATLHGATAIGLENDLGSLEKGKIADLIVFHKNPLDDIRNTDTIQYVMKNGRLYNGDTLDETWPRQKPLSKIWWSDLEPNGVPGVKK